LIASSLEKFTNEGERSAWQQGYEAAFERQSPATQFEQHLKEMAPETISLIGLDSLTWKRVREVYENSNSTERQKYAFMCGLLNGLSEVASLETSTPQ